MRDERWDRRGVFVLLVARRSTNAEFFISGRTKHVRGKRRRTPTVKSTKYEIGEGPRRRLTQFRNTVRVVHVFRGSPRDPFPFEFRIRTLVNPQAPFEAGRIQVVLRLRRTLVERLGQGMDL